MSTSRLFLMILATVLAGCGPSQEDVVRNYVRIMHANYQDALVDAKTAQAAINAFVANPTASSHEAAKSAWISSRPSYMQTEVTRFFGGPIDVPAGLEAPEGRLNAWPIDEGFIDYTYSNPSAGIINDPVRYPQITPEVLAKYNGYAGEENRAMGWHAIEFLLWGQRKDMSMGAGDRPYTDYVDNGTAKNQERRRDYLRYAAQLLVSDIGAQVAAWDDGDKNTYASRLIAAPSQESGRTKEDVIKESLTKLMNGMLNMAVFEMLYERMDAPYKTREPKDQHSCFSETTYNDLVANGLGVQNVYLGRYGKLEGPGFSDLVRQSDPALDDELRKSLERGMDATRSMPQPFDHAVLAKDDNDPQRVQVKEAIDAWDRVRVGLEKLGPAVGLELAVTGD